MKLADKTNRTSLVWRLLLPFFVLLHGTDLLAQTCVQPPPGIIAWWPFDETTGTIAADIAGIKPAAYFGAPVQTSGKVGGALRFNGSTDFAAAGDSDQWAFGTADLKVK